MRTRHLVHASLLVVVFLVGCAKRMQREATAPGQVETLDHKAPYLKIHTRRGEVYVLSPWTSVRSGKMRDSLPLDSV